MSAETDLLRAAATRLRDMADAATPTPWHIDADAPSVVRGGPTSMVVVEGWAPDTRLAALMGDPDMVRDLADWLDAIAAPWEMAEDQDDPHLPDPDGWPTAIGDTLDSYALTIARRIMREDT